MDNNNDVHDADFNESSTSGSYSLETPGTPSPGTPSPGLDGQTQDLPLDREPAEAQGQTQRQTQGQGRTEAKTSPSVSCRAQCSELAKEEAEEEEEEEEEEEVEVEEKCKGTMDVKRMKEAMKLQFSPGTTMFANPNAAPVSTLPGILLFYHSKYTFIRFFSI